MMTTLKLLRLLPDALFPVSGTSGPWHSSVVLIPSGRLYSLLLTAFLGYAISGTDCDSAKTECLEGVIRAMSTWIRERLSAWNQPV
jgi:hypothetical protein